MSVEEADLAAAGKYALGAVPAAIAIVGLFRGPGALRSRLKHDVDMVEKLPPNSDAQELLLAHVAGQIERIAKLDTEGRRDWPGFVIATILSTGLAAVAVWMFTFDHWYWKAGAIVVAVLALAGASTIPEYAAKVPRDEKDKPI